MLPFITALALGLDGLNLVLPLAPLGLVAVEALCAAWGRWPNPLSRLALTAAAGVATIVAWSAATSLRPGGTSLDDFGTVVGATSRHLVQLVGSLSWTDAPTPTWAVLLWWGLIAALAYLAVIEEPASARAGAVVLALGIVAAWILEYGEGATDGEYWQGRYTTPLIVGLPMVLASRAHTATVPISGRVRGDAALAVGGFVVVNVAFVSTMYRWGAGVDGPANPFRWINWDSPLHPAVAIAAFACTTALMWVGVVRCARPAPREEVAE